MDLDYNDKNYYNRHEMPKLCKGFIAIDYFDNSVSASDFNSDAQAKASKSLIVRHCMHVESSKARTKSFSKFAETEK